MSSSFRGIVIEYAVAATVVIFCVVSQGLGQGVAGAPRTAILTGHVTDAQGHAVAAVSVLLFGNNEHLSGQTDSDGKYYMSFLGPGTYTGRAEAAGYETATFGPFTLGDNEAKTTNIVLHPKSSEQHTALGAPDFFDQPQFTIAGVTDTTNLGGHASGMAAPTESLAKDVASLRDTTPTLSVNTEVEQAALASAKRNPDDFEANYHAGNLLLTGGKPADAIPFLQRASRLKSMNYDAGYALARAYANTGEYDEARASIRKLQSARDNADLHHLLATIEENSGNPLESEKEYQRAAKLEASETNLFDWGMELLAHRAIDPAIEVFRSGNRRFPESVRMLTALGVAFYERGSYEDALRYVGAASDLNPQDPSPYLLLGKMQNADNGQSEVRLTRLERFARLHPENAWANYYYALALWRQRRASDNVAISRRVESLLQKAVSIDSQFALAYFQLGVLYAEAKDQSSAISSFETAVRVDPKLEQAHYRLAQAYMAVGQRSRSQEEIQLYKQISKSKADDAERQRKEIRQFVYTLQDLPSPEQPH